MKATLTYAGLVALVLLATARGPLWWTLVGLALALWGVLALAPRSVQRRGILWASVLSAAAIVVAAADFA